MVTNNQPLKFYEITNWLFDQTIDIPGRFIEQKTKVNSFAAYLPEMFWRKLSTTNYLNKHLNDLYNIQDGLETLTFLKKVIRSAGIAKSELYQLMPSREADLVKEVQDQTGYDEGNASSRALMLNKMDKRETIYKRQAATKKALQGATTTADKNLVESVLLKKKQEEAKHANKSNVGTILQLSQELIDQEGLVLFDISLLKKTNRVLFIFIDRDNHKRYYTEGFHATIFKSIRDGVINNDYIVDKNDTDFQSYIIKDITLYNKLKYILNNSYKRIINGT